MTIRLNTGLKDNRKWCNHKQSMYDVMRVWSKWHWWLAECSWCVCMDTLICRLSQFSSCSKICALSHLLLWRVCLHALLYHCCYHSSLQFSYAPSFSFHCSACLTNIGTSTFTVNLVNHSFHHFHLCLPLDFCQKVIGTLVWHPSLCMLSPSSHLVLSQRVGNRS